MARILVVDDDQVLQRLVEVVLRKEGHVVACAENGYAALEKLSRETFDLIISDANMPGGLSGFSLVATVKQDITVQHIPVIFLTGRSQKEDVVRARQSGVSDYLIKPVNHAMLISKVKALTSGETPPKPLAVGEVGTLGRSSFGFRIIDLNQSEIEILSPIALPTHFEFKIESDLFQSIGISTPALKAVNCIPFKQGEEAYRIRAQLLGLKIAELDRLEDWLARETIEKTPKVAG